MFEVILAEVLTRFLGEFVREFSVERQRLKLTLWKGDLQLSNLELRPDALSRFLDLPVRGWVGTLFVRIPWKNLAKQPLVIHADGIHAVILSPASARQQSAGEHSQSPEDAAQEASENKKRRLAIHDLNMARAIGRSKHKHRKSEDRDVADASPSSPSSSSSSAQPSGLKAKVLKKLLSNIQLKVTNFHLRYEADTATGGITLASLVVRPESEGSGIKVVSVEHFSVYVDHTSDRAPADRDAFISFMSRLVPPHPSSSHFFVISPFGFSLRVAWGEGLSARARLAISGDVDNVAISLSEAQYRSALEFLHALRRKIEPTAGKAACERPVLPVHQDPRGWLRYALLSVLSSVRERRRRLTPVFFVLRRAYRIEYTSLYKKKLLGKSKKDDRKRLAEMEEQLELQDTMFFRSLAVIQARKERPMTPEKQSPPPPHGSAAQPQLSAQLVSFSQPSPQRPPSTASLDEDDDTPAKPEKKSLFGRLGDKLKTKVKKKSPASSSTTSLPFVGVAAPSASSVAASTPPPAVPAAEDKSASAEELPQLSKEDKEELMTALGITEGEEEPSAVAEGIPLFAMDLRVIALRLMLTGGQSGAPLIVATIENFSLSAAKKSKSGAHVSASLGNISIADFVTSRQSLPYILARRNEGKPSSGDSPIARVLFDWDPGAAGSSLSVTCEPLNAVLSQDAFSRAVTFFAPPAHIDLRELGDKLGAWFSQYFEFDSGDSKDRVRSLDVKISVEGPRIFLPTPGNSTPFCLSFRRLASKTLQAPASGYSISVDGAQISLSGESDAGAVPILSPLDAEVRLQLKGDPGSSVALDVSTGDLKLQSTAKMITSVVRAIDPAVRSILPFLSPGQRTPAGDSAAKVAVATGGAGQSIFAAAAIRSISLDWLRDEGSARLVGVRANDISTKMSSGSSGVIDGLIRLSRFAIVDSADRNALSLASGIVATLKGSTSQPLRIDIRADGATSHVDIPWSADLVRGIAGIIPVVSKSAVAAAPNEAKASPRPVAITIGFSSIGLTLADSTSAVTLGLAGIGAEVAKNKASSHATVRLTRCSLGAKKGTGPPAPFLQITPPESLPCAELHFDAKKGGDPAAVLIQLRGISFALTDSLMDVAALAFHSLPTLVQLKGLFAAPAVQQPAADRKKPTIRVEVMGTKVSCGVPSAPDHFEARIRDLKWSNESGDLGTSSVEGATVRVAGVDVLRSPLDVSASPRTEGGNVKLSAKLPSIEVSVSPQQLSAISGLLLSASRRATALRALAGTTSSTTALLLDLAMNQVALALPGADGSSTARAILGELAITSSMSGVRQTFELSAKSLAVVLGDTKPSGKAGALEISFERKADQKAFSYFMKISLAGIAISPITARAVGALRPFAAVLPASAAASRASSLAPSLTASSQRKQKTPPTVWNLSLTSTQTFSVDLIDKGSPFASVRIEPISATVLMSTEPAQFMDLHAGIGGISLHEGTFDRDVVSIKQVDFGVNTKESTLTASIGRVSACCWPSLLNSALSFFGDIPPAEVTRQPLPIPPATAAPVAPGPFSALSAKVDVGAISVELRAAHESESSLVAELASASLSGSLVTGSAIAKAIVSRLFTTSQAGEKVEELSGNTSLQCELSREASSGGLRIIVDVPRLEAAFGRNQLDVIRWLMPPFIRLGFEQRQVQGLQDRLPEAPAPVAPVRKLPISGRLSLHGALLTWRGSVSATIGTSTCEWRRSGTGKVDLSVAVASVVVVDAHRMTREESDTSIALPVLSLLGKGAVDPVVLKYSYSPETRAIAAEVSIDSPTVAASPGMISVLQQDAMWLGKRKRVDAFPVRDVAAAAAAPNASAAGATSLGLQTEITLIVKRLEMKIFENEVSTYELARVGVDGTFALTLNPNQTISFRARAENLRVEAGVVAQQDSECGVSCQCGAIALTGSSEGNGALRVHADFSPMALDAKRQSLPRLFQALSGLGASKRILRQKRLQAHRDVGHAPWELTPEPSDQAVVGRREPAFVSRVRLLLSSRVRIDISFAELSTSVTAATGESLRVQLSAVYCSFGNNQAGSLQASVACQARAHGSGPPDSIIDPWDAIATVTEARCASFLFTSPKRLSLSLSPVSMRAILAIVRGRGPPEAVSHEQHSPTPHAPSPSQLVCPGFALKNSCGAAVSIVPAEGGQLRLEVSEWGISEPFKPDLLEVAIAVKNASGESLFVVASSEPNPGPEKTIVLVRSPVTMFNGTDLQVELSEHGGEGDAVPHFPITPSKGVPVPVAFAALWKTFCVRLRLPSGCTRWSEPVPWACRSGTVDLSFVGDYGSRHFLVARAFIDGHVGLPDGSKGPTKLRVALAPAIRLENLLPQDAEIEVSDGEVAHRVKIGSGSTVSATGLAAKPGKRLIGVCVHLGHTRTTVESIELDSAVRAGTSIIRTLRSDVPEFPDLRVECQKEQLGVWRVTIWCQFWLLNKTGLNLVLEGRGVLRTDDARPSPFSVPDANLRLMYMPEIGLPRAGWSAPVPLSVLGTSSLEIRGGGDSTIAVSVGSGSGRFNRTTTVVLRPVFVAKNATQLLLLVRQPFSAVPERTAPRLLHPGEQTSILCSRNDDTILDVILEGYDASLPFSATELDSFSLRLHVKGKPCAILPVEIRKDGPTTTLLFKRDEGTAPYTIQNFSDRRLTFCQKGLPQFTQVIDPLSQCHFAWDSHLLPKILSVCSQDVDVRPGASTTITIPRVSHAPARSLRCTVEAEGSTWTIKVRPTGEKDQQAEWTMVESKSQETPLLDLAVSLPSLAFTLVDDGSAVMHLILEVIEFGYSLTNSEHTASLILRNLRVHNDIPRARHPVLFSGGSTLSPRASVIRYTRISPGFGPHAHQSQFLTVKVSKLTRVITHDLHYIPSATVMTQLIRLSVDEELVEALLCLFEKVLPPSPEEQQQQQQPAASPAELALSPALTPATPDQQQPHNNPVYVESLKITPVQIVIAFSPADPRQQAQQQQRHQTAAAPARLLRGLKWASAILGAISESPIELSPLVLDSAMLPGGFKALGTIVRQHYVSQAVSKILSLARGSGTLGTTASFFTKIALRFGLAESIGKMS